MKKFLKSAICFVLALIVVLPFVACGKNNDIYGGKYTKVTDKAEIEQLLQYVANAFSDTEAWVGYKISMKTTMPDYDKTATIKATGYITMKDDEIEMSMKMSSNRMGYAMTGNEYYKDGWMYSYIKRGSEISKTKERIDFFDYNDTYSLDGVYEFFDMFNLGTAESDLKISATSDKGGKNVKFYSEELDIELIIALNAEGAVVGIKMKMKMTVREGIGRYVNMDITCIYEPYSGEVSFPDDLDSYIEEDDDDDDYDY